LNETLDYVCATLGVKCWFCWLTQQSK